MSAFEGEIGFPNSSWVKATQLLLSVVEHWKKSVFDKQPAEELKAQSDSLDPTIIMGITWYDYDMS